MDTHRRLALLAASVLDTVLHAAVARYALPKVHGLWVTPLTWRAADQSPALLALRKVVAAIARPAAGA